MEKFIDTLQVPADALLGLGETLAFLALGCWSASSRSTKGLKQIFLDRPTGGDAEASDGVSR
jgi:hypothetical protein